MPRGNPRVPVNIRLDASATTELKQLAEETERSVSWHIEKAVQQYLRD